MIEWDDGDGWCKGKNKDGQDGYFPQSYVQELSRPSSPTGGPTPTGAGIDPQLSVTSNSTITSEGTPVAYTNGLGTL